MTVTSEPDNYFAFKLANRGQCWGMGGIAWPVATDGERGSTSLLTAIREQIRSAQRIQLVNSWQHPADNSNLHGADSSES